jgi:hypothetical protein
MICDTIVIIDLLERSVIASLIVYFFIFWLTGGSIIVNKGKVIVYIPDWMYVTHIVSHSQSCCAPINSHIDINSSHLHGGPLIG